MAFAQMQSADSLFRHANELYKQGNYAAAEDTYRKIAESGYHSAELYYNLGNTAYKQNRLIDAVYYFEKALKLNPNFGAAKDNLTFVRRGLQSGTEKLPEVFYKKIWKKFVRLFSSDTWAVLSLIVLFLIAGFILLFVFSSSPKYKKIAFYTLPALLFLWFVFLFSAYSAYQNENKKYGIIIQKQVELFNEPTLDSKVENKGVGGEKVELLEEDEFWSKVKFPDGKTYWITRDSYKKL